MALPVKVLRANFEAYVQNIIDAWTALSDADKAAGDMWYDVARDIARMLGDGDVRKGAGYLAALSPLKSWEVNVQLATDAAQGNIHGNFGDACRKAEAIHDGADPATVLPMNLKTGNFYANIVGIDDDTRVTVDRHAYRVATGDSNYSGLQAGGYKIVMDAYLEAGRRLGKLGKHVQAGVWIPEARGW